MVSLYFQSTKRIRVLITLSKLHQVGSYKAIFGIGFALRNAVEAAAKDHSDINYVIIDDEIKGQDNVASCFVCGYEAVYLAGVAQRNN